MSPHLDKKVGKRHAVIPHAHHLFAQIVKRRVEKNDRFLDVQDNQAFKHANLRGSDGTAYPVPSTEVNQCVVKIPDDRIKALHFTFVHWGINLIEFGITQ